MRTFAGFCLSASLLATPAFAQVAAASQDSAAQRAVPLSSNIASGKTPDASRSAKETADGGLSLGVLDRLTLKRETERSLLPVAPIETDQLALSWRPGGKWGIMLDMTTRSENHGLLPKEELSAGAYYQITPRLRFGGGLTLNGDKLRDAVTGWTQRQGEAGVRIESAFSF